MNILKLTIVAAAALVSAASAAIYFGVYNVAADDPHWDITYKLLDTARARSIAVRSRAIVPPKLDDAAEILRGAGNYSAMCVSCHLAPGQSDTELSLSLYPKPPNYLELAKRDVRESFWAIKHGIKMSGMPAWGQSMDDKYVWGMVAFIRTMPNLSTAQYEDAVGRSGGHDHGGGETQINAIDSAAPPESGFEVPEDPMAQ